jgi:tetratricopeptide (TPR) repeat protein/DNA-directed RNA polymerase subunit RPC12/RpoP
MKICPQCGTENEDSYEYCIECGKTLTPKTAEQSTAGAKCPQCGSVEPAGNVFCGKCGAEINPEAVQSHRPENNKHRTPKTIPTGEPLKPEIANTSSMGIIMRNVLFGFLVSMAFIMCIFAIYYFSRDKLAKKAIQYTAVLIFKPRDTDILIERADVYFQLAKYDKAINDYTKLIGYFPDNDDILLKRAETYIMERDFENARTDYLQVLNQNPDSITLILKKGDAYFAKKEYNKAICLYSAAIETNPDYETYLKRGDTYFYALDYANAAEDYSILLKDNSNNISLLKKRGEVFFLAENYNLAKEDFTKILLFTNNDSEAIIRLADIAKLQNDGNVEPLIKRAWLYFSEENFDQALLDIEYALFVRQDFDLLALQGTIYFDRKEYAKAITSYGKAIALNPGQVKYYYNRGLAYYYKGLGEFFSGTEYKNALDDFTKAIGLNLTEGRYYYMRANVYYEQKNWTFALEDYDEALKFSPGLYREIAPKRQICLQALKK